MSIERVFCNFLENDLSYVTTIFLVPSAGGYLPCSLRGARSAGRRADHTHRHVSGSRSHCNAVLCEEVRVGVSRALPRISGKQSSRCQLVGGHCYPTPSQHFLLFEPRYNQLAAYQATLKSRQRVREHEKGPRGSWDEI